MRGARIGAMAVLGLLVGSGSSGHAQDKGEVQLQDLRVDWEVVSTRGAWRNVCGRVFNERGEPARNVFVQFDGIEGGKVVSSRFIEVVGDVPAHGYAIYCMQVSTKGTSYRVTVPTVAWGFTQGQ